MYYHHKEAYPISISDISKSLRLAARTSPIPVDEWTRQFTELYYACHHIGQDFLTPQEFFPQMGACYAAFACRIYEHLGSPPEFPVYELGAGNGTLAKSFVEEATNHPQFFHALRYHIVEQSDMLIAHQQELLSTGGFAHAVFWHRADVTRFSFPSLPTGMVIAIELDDDLPSKAVYKRGGLPKEVHITNDEEKGLHDVEMEATAELLAFIASYPQWWELLPENMQIPWPVHTASVRMREHIASMMERGVIITVDYGHELRTVAPFARNFVFSPYKLFYRNQKLFPRDDSFAKAFHCLGEANYTVAVDFTQLELPAHTAGFQTVMTGNRDIIARFGLQDQVVRQVKSYYSLGDTEGLQAYLRKLAYVVDPYGDWTALVQWRGFNMSMPPLGESQPLAGWLYQLASEYGMGDIYPYYRTGPTR